MTMPNSKTKKTLFAISAALLIALVAVGVVAAAGLESPVFEEDTALQGSPKLAGPFEVSGPDVDQVAVLGEKADAEVAPALADALPGSASALSLSLGGQGVEEPVPAHEVARGLAEPITVAEVGVDACVGVRGLATCGSPTEILAGRVVAAEICSPIDPGEVRVLGMVPDGVAEVQIETQDGSSVAVPVTENVYEASLRGVPETIVWNEDAGGRSSYPAPVPPGFSPKGCG
jgi:hypothetical protein